MTDVKSKVGTTGMNDPKTQIFTASFIPPNPFLSCSKNKSANFLVSRRTFTSCSVNPTFQRAPPPVLTHALGNDPDEDSDREPAPPPKVVEKSLPRSSKRNAPEVPPSESRRGAESERGGRGGRRGGHSGNDDGMR
jgi:hypothetical protein